MSARSLAFAPLLLAMPATASAQDIPPYFDPVIAGQGILLSDMVEKAGKQARDGGAGLREGASVRQPLAALSAPAADVDATYRPSAAVRRRLAGIMAESSERRRAGTGEEMGELVESGRAMSEYRRIAPSLGYDANDAADSLAFYMLALWGVANDHRADITRAQAAGVARQAHNAYATIAGQLDTDAKRQEFGEMLAIQAAIIAGAHEAAVRNGDDAMLRRYAGLARQGGRKILDGDPTRIALTDSGFRPK